MAEQERLSRWLAAGRRRLVARRVWRGSAIGGFAGAAVAVLAVSAARLVFAVDAPVAVGLALGVPALGGLAGAVVSAVRWTLDRRGVALVLDQVAKTDERLITALHLAEAMPDDPRSRAAVAALDDVEIDDLVHRLPVRWPRTLRLVPVLVAAALGLVFLPAGRLSGLLPERTQTSLSEAGERLQERLAEIEPPPEAPVWPEDVGRKVAELAEDMRADRITEAEAADELEQLAKGIEALESSLSEAEDALDALEQAARELDEPGTQAMKDALQSGDPRAAQEAAERLQESLSGADPQTRERAAESLKRAADELARSGDPGLAGAGEALRDAAEQAMDGQLSPEQARQLAEQLEQARAAGERMQRDRQALERAQRVAGAIESARQQLGERTPDGQSSQQAGEGEGSRSEPGGEGDGEVSDGPPGPGAGSRAGTRGHTWEDQGERRGAPPGGDGEERTSDRREGQHIDDFEKFYDAVRLAGAESLVAGTNSTLHEEGQVDELEYRLTTAEESATTGRVALPDAYREAASAAIDAEPIPPAYRNAVRDYFGEME